MRVVLTLLPGVAALTLRRLTRTQNVRWPRWRVYVPLCALLVGAVAIGTIVVAGNPPTDPLIVTFYRPTVAVLMTIVAGAAIMAMEGSRDRSGSTGRALESLPLRRREAAFLVRLPSLCLGALVILGPISPALGALRSVQTSMADAVQVVLTSLGAGLVTAAIPYLGIALLLRSRRWDAVRTPVSLLLWAGLLVWQLAVALRGLAGDSAPEWMPAVASLTAAVRGDGDSATTMVWIALGAVSAIAVGLTFALVDRTDAAPSVRRPWRGGAGIGRILGELRYALRDPALRANASLAVLLVAGIALCAPLIPAEARGQTETALLLPVGLLAASVCRAIRGIYPATFPVQRLIAMSPVSWALSTSTVVLSVALLICLPSTLLLLSSTDIASTSWRLLTTALLASSAGIAVGAALPVGARNVLGQGLTSGLAIGAFVTSSVVVTKVGETSPSLAVLVCCLALTASFGIATLCENLRWQPRLPRTESPR